jgi:hypothetical protein
MLKLIGKYTENGLQNPKNIPQHFMCKFLIFLHIVSLSVGSTFTPCIFCIYITYIYYLHNMEVLWGPFDPKAEININKNKRKDTKSSECV